MRVLTDLLFDAFKKALPPISQTEMEALEAGETVWDKNIFTGDIDWGALFDYEQTELTHEEQMFIEGPVQQFCEMINDYQINHVDHDLTPEAWQFLKDNRFFSLIIPKEYGGLDFSHYAHACIVMKIATRSIAAAVTVMVPNSLGPGKLLLKYGTKEQQEKYLPRLATGEEIPAFALTNPNAGSDAGGIPDHGVVCYGEWEGEEVLGIRLNWEKRYITLGPVATLLGVAFKLYDPNHFLDGESFESDLGNASMELTNPLGITLALIPTDMPGVTIGDRHNPLGVGFMNGPNWGKDVFIPMDYLIGGQDYIGKGWKMLVECLSVGRGISLPSLFVGGSKLASRYTGAYARIREQFRLPISKFEGIEEALARIAGYTYMVDAAERLMLYTLDHGHNPSVMSAIVKYHITEIGRKVLNDAMDIQGGSGICLGDKNLIGNFYQAIPVGITVEGANILTRSMIIFGQGSIRNHPYILDEMMAVQNGDKDAFNKALLGHIKYTATNLVMAPLKSWFYRLNPIAMDTRINFRLRNYYQRIERLSSALALTSDVTMMLLGGKLKRKERLSARLGDVLSNLYMAQATLKRFHDTNWENEALVVWSLKTCLYEAEQALNDFFKNFGIVGKALKLMVLPVMVEQKPTDVDDHKAAAVLLKPSSDRNSLTDGVFISNDEEDQLNKAEVLLKMIDNNMGGKMNQEQIAPKRRDIIDVNHFEEL